MRDPNREKMIAHINRKEWWHVPPLDPRAYQKRGKFLSSTFREAAFYGRPLDRPQKLKVSNPLIGDEDAIEKELLGRVATESERERLTVPAPRFAIDAKLKRAALFNGYDSIVLLSPQGLRVLQNERKNPAQY